MKDCLLIIEDEQLLGNELKRYFVKQNWEVIWVQSILEAKKILQKKEFDPIVVLSDMNLPDGNALDFLEYDLKENNDGKEWLFLTGYGSIADSVRAVRLGAFDFIEKPCELNRINLLIEGAARSAKAQRRLIQETQLSHDKYSIHHLLGQSLATLQLKNLLKRIVQVPFSSLIIHGETGTGKGLLAKIIHYNGKRASFPLVEINCAALPKDLLESELFGYEAGAFTNAKKRHRGLFEQAHQGTLFLDEIAELDLDLQSKLLKVVEELKFRRLGSEKEIDVDVQIIAASNRNLLEQVEKRNFREDLYHRLSVLAISVESLRERPEDIEQMVPVFIAEFNSKSGKKVNTALPHQTLLLLKNYHWPGNIRELRNVIERCVLLAEDQNLPEQWLQLPGQLGLTAKKENQDTKAVLSIPLDGSLSLDGIEKYVLQSVLSMTHNNVTAAARMLDTTRETLRYRVNKHHIKL